MKKVKLEMPENEGVAFIRQESENKVLLEKNCMLLFENLNYMTYIFRRKICKDTYPILKVLFSGTFIISA